MGVDPANLAINDVLRDEVDDPWDHRCGEEKSEGEIAPEEVKSGEGVTGGGGKEEQQDDIEDGEIGAVPEEFVDRIECVRVVAPLRIVREESRRRLQDLRLEFERRADHPDQRQHEGDGNDCHHQILQCEPANAE